MINLIHGEALEEMDKLIAQGVKVDAIITDIPYGTTACQWDEVIDLQKMWFRLKLLARDENTPILLFGQQPFTSVLISSNIKNFKWQWYYKKQIASNFASAKYQPMKHIEDVCVFTPTGKKPNFYPILQPRAESGKSRINAGFKYNSEGKADVIGGINRNNTDVEYNADMKNPENIQQFNNRAKGARGFHPTQKPIELMEYLIKSHTNENETVLDFTMGSGTTGLAAKNLNRDFIGIELDENYFKIASERIKNMLY